MPFSAQEISEIDKLILVMARLTSEDDSYSSYSLKELEFQTRLSPNAINKYLKYLSTELKIIDYKPNQVLSKNYTANLNISSFISNGGFKTFVFQKRKQDNKEREAHQALLNSSKSAIISALIAGLTFIWGIYQTYITNNLNIKVEKLEKKINSQDSIITLQKEQLVKIRMLLK